MNVGPEDVGGTGAGSKTDADSEDWTSEGRFAEGDRAAAGGTRLTSE